MSIYLLCPKEGEEVDEHEASEMQPRGVNVPFVPQSGKKKAKKKVMKKVKVSGSSAVSSTRQWVFTCRNITAEAKLILDDVSDDLSDDVCEDVSEDVSDDECWCQTPNSQPLALVHIL